MTKPILTILSDGSVKIDGSYGGLEDIILTILRNGPSGNGGRSTKDAHIIPEIVSFDVGVESEVYDRLDELEEYIRRKPNLQHDMSELTKFVYGKEINYNSKENGDKKNYKTVARHARKLRKRIIKEPPGGQWITSRVERNGRIRVISMFIPNQENRDWV